MTTYAHIAGWGKYLPQRVMTNEDIARLLGISADWIETRTGIAARRFADENETTASMATIAARQALAQANIAPEMVDLIIVATLSPDHLSPATASLVQDALGADRAGAFDLSAACSGFVYALSMGVAMIRSGEAHVVLVIGSETISRFLDKADPKTFPLFGDGAGALVLQGSEQPGGALTTLLGSDGSGARHLGIPAGGSRFPATHETVAQGLHYLKMNGRQVFRFATRTSELAAKQVCAKAGLTIDDIDLFIPHQANIRIIEHARKHLKVSADKVFTNLEKYGNTSAASIPIALCEAIETNRLQPDDKLVMVGFGGGLSWAAMALEWTAPLLPLHSAAEPLQLTESILQPPSVAVVPWGIPRRPVI